MRKASGTSFCWLLAMTVFLRSMLAQAEGLAYTNRPLERGPADPTLPFIKIYQAEKAPVVDGKLDDACWAKAEEGTLATDEYSFPISEKTTFKICQKDDVLYIGIRAFYGEKGGQKTGDGGSHDGALWNGENIEMFIDPDNEDSPGYYQLILTPFDVTGDFYNSAPRDPEKRWEPKYEVKSQWTSNEWTIEYGIPLSAFNYTKTIYENFGFNLHRVYQEIGAWAAGHSEGFHFPHKFGEVRGLRGAQVTKNEPGRFRSPELNINDRVIHAQATPSLIPEKTPALVAGPTVKASGKSAEISFEVNTKTDVAIWIEDSHGEQVCHLAAGMLGDNAPAPLQKNSLKQELVWNYTDDLGNKVAKGDYKVQVGVGSKARLEKEIGRSEDPYQINGIGVDKQGCIYTFEGERDQWSRIKKYNSNGKFASMLMPPPADIPVEKLKGLNIIDYGPDGQVRFGGRLLGETMPSLEQPFPQNLVVNSKGQIIFAGCEYQGGPARFYKINSDGSLPDDFLGPYIKDVNWLNYYENWAKRFHFAVDPLDDDVILLSGLKECHRLDSGGPVMLREMDPNPKRKETFYNAIGRLRWGQDAGMEMFIGKRNLHGWQGGNKPGEFLDPQGIAFDKDNNLWVCDRQNNRIQVFDRNGKFLWQLPHIGPYEVRVNSKTGERYALSATPTNFTIKGTVVTNLHAMTLTKYAAGKNPKILAQTTLPGNWSYWWDMALDDTSKKPCLYFVWAGNVNSAHGITSRSAGQIWKIEDLGNAFGTPKHIFGRDDPIQGYYRVAVSWEDDIICAYNQFWFDGKTGKRLTRAAALVPKEVAATRDGKWATRSGFDHESIQIYPAEWATNSEVSAIYDWQLQPPSMTRAGERGFCTAPNGDIYVVRYYQWTRSGGARAGEEGPDHHVAIDHYSQDGKRLGHRVVYELSGGACAPAVDIKGNIFVCDNMGRKLGQFYEDDVAPNMPTWAPDYQISDAEWEQLKKGNSVEAGYRKFAINPLFRHVGALYKFSPKGGGLLWRAAQGEYEQFWPGKDKDGNPIDLYPDWGFPFAPKPTRPATHWSSTWRSGSAGEGLFPVWHDGVEWEFLGVSPSPGRFTKGHDACICFNLRICADDFGRVYAPAAHRNTIRMIDTAGNEVLRIGRYGNLDSGPTARLKEPNIPLRFPTATALSKRYLYVVEQDIARILQIKLGYEAVSSANISIK